MNNPFTSWINIPVSNYNLLGSYDKIDSFLDSCNQNNLYAAVATSGSYTANWDFYVNTASGTISHSVISFSIFNDQEVLKGVMNDENLVFACDEKLIFQPETWKDGIVITEKVWKELSTTRKQICEDSKQIMIKDGINLPLQIIAVVKSLPYQSDVFCENLLTQSVSNYGETEMIEKAETNSITIAIMCSLDERDELKIELENLINETIELDNNKVLESSITSSDSFVGQNTKMVFVTQNPFDFRTKEAIHKALSRVDLPFYNYNAAVLVAHKLKTPEKTEVFGKSGENHFDILSIKFSDFKEIQSFNTDVIKRFKMKLNMSEVESKRNFTLVSFLTISLIIGIVFFALYSVVMFITSTMKNHLEKIKVNLGTFMAFGMPNEFLRNGYTYIILKMMSISFVISILLLYIIYFLSYFMLSAFKALPDLYSYIYILSNPWLWSTSVVLFAMSIGIFNIQLRQFLNHSPGDLIYGRS